MDKNVVETGKQYEVEIIGMNHEGQGVGRVEGLAVFVDGAIEGETVKAKITKVSKNYAVAELVSILKSSPERTEPFCGCYSECGGCSLQHMSYRAQLDFKTKLVRDSLIRIGKLHNVTVHDTIGMEIPERYRNKAQFPVAMGKGGASVGFYAKRSHKIVEGANCGIQDEISDLVRDSFREFVSEAGLKAYDEKTGIGLIRHVMTRVGFKTGEVMVVIVINGKELPGKEKLVARLQQLFPAEGRFKLKSVYLNINTKNTNIILGEKSVLIYGSKVITDYISDLKFEISPLSFFQVNPVQTEVLYGKALEYAALTGKERVFDLYCGIGTISLFLARKAQRVYGVESVEPAVEDAKRNAEINGIKNAEFLAGEAEVVVPRLYKEGIKADVVVVDPPRKGCEESLLKTLVDMEPERIVYVSCNPSTLARDLYYLDQHGYRAVEVQPVDMFPYTAHVETIVLIQRVYT